MLKISDCAEIYQNLLNKEYYFTLEENIKFKLEFSPAYFYHLLGLEKLTDIAQLRTGKPTKIFKDILKGNISDETITKSHCYGLIEDRINNFQRLPDLLIFRKSNKIIVDFDKTRLDFRTKLQFTKYILYTRNGTKYIHLTIGKKNTLYPETFIVEEGSKYISGQKLLDILDISIRERQKKLMLEWDPDFTKLTPAERKRLEEAEADPEVIGIDEIDWD